MSNSELIQYLIEEGFELSDKEKSDIEKEAVKYESCITNPTYKPRRY